MPQFIIFAALAVCVRVIIGVRDDHRSSLQIRMKNTFASGGTFNNPHNLAFVHVPYNFGNTISLEALFPPEGDYDARLQYLKDIDGEDWGHTTKQSVWEDVNKSMRENGEVWGHLNPDLQVKSNITGCPLYLTPQKHWPKDVAEKYFGNRVVFGVLRDPYERLVAQFRGDFPTYGGNSSFIKTCDVNTAVKQKMKDYLQSKDMFGASCTLIPQAEFFDMPYGITIPIDNFRFPDSMNEVFKKHGYNDMHIKVKTLFHVWKCENSWSADFDDETRNLVKQVYARDFDLLCEHFNYCDFRENTCIAGVPQMCPGKLFKWDDVKEVYCNTSAVPNIRVNPKCRM